MARALMLDLEGTLYTREGAIEGACDAIAFMRENNFAIRFLTNTDSKDNATLLEYVSAFGLDIRPEELFTPVNAAAQILTQADGCAFVVGTPSITRQLASVVTVTSEPAEATHVIIGDCRSTLSYDLLDQAFSALVQGAEFLALQRGKFFLSGGKPHIDTGAIVAALEYAAQCEATVVGKPAQIFLQAAVDSLPQTPAPSDIWVVGDDATTDIPMGRAFGATTIQVRTGKFTPEDEGATHVISSIAALPDLLGR
ncbi:MAG: HAD hydrolase-like protein [Actinomycetaceae bacterium]|nr:HAD hydrolase-like protein [Actinomycetaceae bacterium]